VAAVAERLRALLARDPRGAIAAYLFGSEARGTAGPGSDVDLAILFESTPASSLAAQPYALEDDLGGALGRSVQVVVLNTAPPDLVHRVLRDGILVLDRDRAARIRFEVQARNAYFDLLPFLERYRRSTRPEP
jgi:predicted nucleotidyltransferase